MSDSVTMTSAKQAESAAVSRRSKIWSGFPAALFLWDRTSTIRKKRRRTK